MTEITVNNFEEYYPIIKNEILKANFITIDTEFSALYAAHNLKGSLFDTAAERYKKLRETVSQIIPFQIGISIFLFDGDTNSYNAKTYTFYLCPRSFNNLEHTFLLNSSSVQFLCNYNFDFNKCFYHGVSFLNKSQELEMHNVFELTNNEDFFDIRSDIDYFVKSAEEEIKNWLPRISKEPELKLTGFKVDELTKELIYYLHTFLRKKFYFKIITFERDNYIIVKEILEGDYKNLKQDENGLKVNLQNYLLGFTKIFRLVAESKRPVIGHNFLTDLLLMYNSFENYLPVNYTNFKNEILKLFPLIYDTKTICFAIRRNIPEEKEWNDNSLEGLYKYFKDGIGRHFAFNSPLIESEEIPRKHHFHNAGFDSFCTGYIFIRMAHILATNVYKRTKNKTITCTEHFASVENFRNQLNMIRCTVSYINLDKNDPESTRPPMLVAEALQDKPIDLREVNNVLRTFGYVEIKPIRSSSKLALVAVDNFKNARKLLEEFEYSTDFRIRRYSILRHSPVARAFIWTSIGMSGAAIIWITRSALKK